MFVKHIYRRFVDKYCVSETNFFDGTPCWEWTGYCFPTGYGCFRGYSQKGGRAHRAAYKLFVGTIPDGLVVHHRCRNKRCVNPEHLEATTQKGNMWDSVCQQRTHCRHGHLWTPESTAIVDKGNGFRGRRCRTCDRARSLRYYYEKRKRVDG